MTQASLAAAGRARPAPAPACEGSLGGKLRYVCQLFFPPRVSPRTAVKVLRRVQACAVWLGALVLCPRLLTMALACNPQDRLSCVLTLDRASLLPEESMVCGALRLTSEQCSFTSVGLSRLVLPAEHRGARARCYAAVRGAA